MFASPLLGFLLLQRELSALVLKNFPEAWGAVRTGAQERWQLRTAGAQRPPVRFRCGRLFVQMCGWVGIETDPVPVGRVPSAG